MCLFGVTHSVISNHFHLLSQLSCLFVCSLLNILSVTAKENKGVTLQKEEIGVRPEEVLGLPDCGEPYIQRGQFSPFPFLIK